MGQPAETYSYDGGQSWTQPQLINYHTGYPLRNPRACPRIWKCKNGKYLLWYHNNGSKSFSNRNPAWVVGGIEVNGKIQWSQPEIFIYGPDHSYESGRFSYPDLIEENGRYWVSTTQKTTATVHEIPAEFFENLWGQFAHRSISKDGLTGEYENFTGPIILDQSFTLENGGFALDFWIEFNDFRNALIFRIGDEQTKKIDLFMTDSAALEFRMSDGEDHIALVSDHGRLKKGKKHHVAILVDADAMITYMLIDGSICDGGGRDTFGFKWFSPSFSAISFSKIFLPIFPGKIHKLRCYHQRKSTSQMVNNYHTEIP
jgi:hypothetical protein